MCQALCQVLGMVNQLGSVSSLRDLANSRDDSYDKESKKGVEGNRKGR